MTSSPSRRRPRWVPGDVILHPVALTSVVLLLLNDHVLKRATPGFVTGKLSDVAAMILCPLLIAAAYEVVVRVVGRGPAVMPPSLVVVVCILVAAGFISMKIFSSVGELYGEIVGALRNAGSIEGGPVAVSADRTDAIAALFVLLPGRVLISRAKSGLHLSGV